MKIYLIGDIKGKRAFMSFRRLLAENNIKERCNNSEEYHPDKDNLPATILKGTVTLSMMEVDERV